MRKTLLSLFLGLAGYSAWAQGTVILQNGNASYLISTNDWLGHVGPTAKTALGFDYAVLTAAFGGPVPSSNPLDAAWSGAVLTGVNFAITAGGISGQGGAAGAAAAGWGAPTGPQYTDGTEKYFLIVGWSSNLGTSWATVTANLNSGWPGPPAGGEHFAFGTSAIGYGFSGGGPYSLPATSLWGVSTGMPGGLTSGFTLIISPEPSTFALAGLGGLSLLLLRRSRRMHRNGE
jgi:hypothetical protein